MTASALMHNDSFACEPAHVGDCMADAIAKRINLNGICPIADITAMGFSLNDIARYWPEACKLAETKRPKISDATNTHMHVQEDRYAQKSK